MTGSHRFSRIVEPWDDFNRELVFHVRPPEWENPRPASRYHLVVIGGGTAGLVCAVGASSLGAKVALVERDLLGGDCLNVGCVPSKALIAAGRAATALRKGKMFGVHATGNIRVDFREVMKRMRRLRASIAPNDSARRLSEKGVDVFFGTARFLDSQTVDVDGKKLRFQKAVIATGTRAAVPPIPGLERVPYLTNETLFSLQELPKTFGIIGAGPIGCEMAQAFSRLGSRVFLIEAFHGVLPREDRDAAGLVEKALTADGVRFWCCAGKTTLARTERGTIRIRLESHGNLKEQELDALLVAVGRTPNVEDLDLERVGVETTRKGVVVDDRLRTTNPRIFAAGDVCSPFQFTHAADFMARIVIRNALFGGRAKASALIIPWCVYTDPELAHVGLSAEEARSRETSVESVTVLLKDVDRAVLEGRSEGMVRLHLRKRKGKILGATLVASHAGEMISEITLAMKHGLGIKDLAETIHPYPTVAEAVRKAGDLYLQGRLTPRIKSVLSRFFAWRIKMS